MHPSSGVALALLTACCCGAGCASAVDSPQDLPPPPAAVVLQDVAPAVLVPGSRVILSGRNFSPKLSHELWIDGEIAARKVELRILAVASSTERAEALLDGSALPPDLQGPLRGTARVDTRGLTGTSQGQPFPVALQFERQLEPRLQAVGQGIVFVHSKVALVGTGLLLTATEGQSVVRLQGCFLPKDAAGSPCATAGHAVDVEAAVDTDSATDREHGTFELLPALMGIAPGSFTGTVTPVNHHAANGPSVGGAPLAWSMELGLPYVEGFEQSRVSLGQFLDLRGAGFVGGEDNGTTLVHFDGDFAPVDGATRPVAFDIVAKYRSGGLARHVLEEKIGIGAGVQLRREWGRLSGTWTPTVLWGGGSVTGPAASLTMEVAPLRQVVWVRFNEQWEAGLRRFGLQAADAAIRDRALLVMRRAYRGINVEIRTVEPKDFALFAKVDVGGPDPNGLGLLGYDNSPGKDVNNERLYDWIGGVNALTQQDGYPGYGGIFVESMLGFSEHPPSGVSRSPLSKPLFDAIFDPFRPDRGNELTVAESVAGAKLWPGTVACPVTALPNALQQAHCAILVLGNLVGNTAAHELGHSLGLADPYGPATQFHNPGDEPNRLMEAGAGRPFEERAELQGMGPAVFCDEEYQYLKAILPLDPPDDPVVQRPGCY